MLHFLLAWTSVVTSGPLHSIHDWQRAKSSIFGSHTYSSLASNALGGRQFFFPSQPHNCNYYTSSLFFFHPCFPNHHFASGCFSGQSSMFSRHYARQIFHATAVAQWLQHLAAELKLAGSIPAMTAMICWRLPSCEMSVQINLELLLSSTASLNPTNRPTETLCTSFFFFFYWL